MAYSPFQDGTQLFGIPDSPVTINSVAYIAEDISINYPTNRVEIKDPNGIPIGQVFLPQVINGTAKLQFAASATIAPVLGSTFTLEGATWYVSNVGKRYSQGAYAYVDITFYLQI